MEIDLKNMSIMWEKSEIRSLSSIDMDELVLLESILQLKCWNKLVKQNVHCVFP